MEPQTDLLADLSTSTPKRRVLLPWWIRVFVWIFMITGLLAPVSVIFALSGSQFQIALYGFESNEPLSIPYIGLAVLFLLKGVVAYGLWNEKSWAVSVGIADGLIGLLICVFVMLHRMNQDGAFIFRLEILLLIPYVIFLFKIRHQWKFGS